MAERPRQRCRTRRCPEPPKATPVQDAAKKASEQLTKATLDPRIVSVSGESDRLWRHVLFGTGTTIGMIEGYVAIGMPGDPLPQLYVLADRLSQIIKTLEGRRNADSRSADR